jgi:Gpi18-like mannosyltransferase
VESQERPKRASKPPAKASSPNALSTETSSRFAPAPTWQILSMNTISISADHMKNSRNEYKVFILIIVISGILIRLLLFKYENRDLWDYLIPWYDYISSHGGFYALSDQFSNYTPPYLYFLTIASYLKFIPKVAAIKLISVIFDFFLAIEVSLVVRQKFSESFKPLLAFAITFLLPTAIIDSSMWGQCDAIYTTFLVASLLFFLRDRPLFGIIWFSVAFAIKAQAAFFAPFILVAFSIQPFKWWFSLIPIGIYSLFALPVIFLGYPIRDIFMIYLNQANTYFSLSLNAPNIYIFIKAYSPILVGVGLLIALAGALIFLTISLKFKSSLNRDTMVIGATFILALMPFLLPKMHGRYFYPAALFSIILMFYYPKLRLIPLSLQLTSLISYIPFLKGVQLIPLELPAILNAIILIWLFLFYRNQLVAFQESMVEDGQRKYSACFNGNAKLVSGRDD